MLPYLLVLSFVTFWTLLEQKAINRKSFWLPWIVLSLFAGIRSFRVGTDSGNYTRDFRNQLDIYNFQFDESVEIGYQLLKYILLSLTDEYFWLFFIASLLIVYCYLNIIKKYSVSYVVSVFLFITLGVYSFSFNGLRQGLAMAIFALALPYLLEKKFFMYVIVCLAASLFHVTALFMIPFYFIVNLNVKPLYKITATFVGSMLVSGFLVDYIATTNERYEGYTEVSESAGGLLTLGFYVLILIFIYLTSVFYKINDEYFKKLFTFYGVGVVFVIPLALLGTNPSGPQRLLVYFTWTLMLILPIVFKKINNIYVTYIAMVAFLTYFILTTVRFSNLTPYIVNPIFEIF